MQIAMHPAVLDLVCDSDCTCEFEAECRKRDAKLWRSRKGQMILTRKNLSTFFLMVFFC